MTCWRCLFATSQVIHRKKSVVFLYYPGKNRCPSGQNTGVMPLINLVRGARQLMGRILHHAQACPEAYYR